MSEEGGSWWSVSSNLWSKAKETGSYVYEFTAKDLGEVATSLKQDVIAPSASALRHQIQPHAQYGSLSDSVATMLGSVSEYLAPDTDTSITYLSRYGDDRLAAIQTNPESYTQHIPDKHFTLWCSDFTLDEHTAEISQLLVNNPALRTVHTQLVPADISYSNFWKVYYYRTDLFQQERRRHEELLARAARVEGEEEEGWGDEEEEEEVTITTLNEQSSDATDTTNTTGATNTDATNATDATNNAASVNQESAEEEDVPLSMTSSTSEADQPTPVTAEPVLPQHNTSPVLPVPDTSSPELPSLESATSPDLPSLESSAVLVDLPQDAGTEDQAADKTPDSTVNEVDKTQAVVDTDREVKAALEGDIKGEDGLECTSDGSYEIVVKGGEDDEFEAELDAMMLDMKEEEAMGSDEDDDWEDWD